MSLPAFKLLLNEVRDFLQRPFKSEKGYRRCTSGEIRAVMRYRIILANMVWITPGNALVYILHVLVAEIVRTRGVRTGCC